MFDTDTSDKLNPFCYRLLHGVHHSLLFWGFTAGILGLQILVYCLGVFFPKLPTFQLRIQDLTLLYWFRTLIIASYILPEFFIIKTFCTECGQEGLDAFIGTNLRPADGVKGVLFATLASLAFSTLLAAPAWLYLIVDIPSTSLTLLPWFLVHMAVVMAIFASKSASVASSRNVSSAQSAPMFRTGVIAVSILFFGSWGLGGLMSILNIDPIKFSGVYYYLCLIALSLFAISCAVLYGCLRAPLQDHNGPARCTLWAVWLLWLPLLPLGFPLLKDALPFNWKITLLIWGGMTICLGLVQLGSSLIESPTCPRRVLHDAPEEIAIRPLYYLGCGGMLPAFYSATLMFLIGLGTLWLGLFLKKPFSTSPADIKLISYLLSLLGSYCFLYTAIAHFIRTKWKISPLKIISLLAVFLSAIQIAFLCFEVPRGLWIVPLHTTLFKALDSQQFCWYYFIRPVVVFLLAHLLMIPSFRDFFRERQEQ